MNTLKLKFNNFFLVVFSFLILQSSIAKSETIANFYDFGFEFLFSDKWQSFFSEDSQDQNPAKDRTFAPTRIDLGLRSEVPEKLALSVHFRPDYFVKYNEKTPSVIYEMDTRVEPPRLDKEELMALDQYEVELLWGKNFHVGVGSIDLKNWQKRELIPRVNEFGLNFHLPEKFTSFYLFYDHTTKAAQTAQADLPLTKEEAIRESFSVRPFTLSKQRRTEVSSKDGFESPSQTTPYFGFGLIGAYTDRKIGNIEGTIILSQDKKLLGNSTISSKVSETYVELKLHSSLTSAFYSPFDCRYAWLQERWLPENDQLKIIPVTNHQLIKIQGLVTIYEPINLLYGLHYAQAEVQKETAQAFLYEVARFSGYQADLGFINNLRPGLELFFLFSHEQRSGKMASTSQKINGFSAINADRLQRLSLGLRAELGGTI